MFTGSAESRLTKAQRTFNRLVRQIEKLQQDIARENSRLDALVSVYVSTVYPMEQEIARTRMEILLKLHQHYSKVPRDTSSRRSRFLKMLKEQLLEHMAQLDGQLDDAFIALFKKVMRCTPNEYKQRRASEAREAIEREIEGMDLGVDLSGLGPNADPETFFRTLDEIEQKLSEREDQEAAFEEPAEKPADARRRSAKEERQRLAEEMRTKDISSLYKQLAKLLHPDLEQDPERRSAKEAAMKQLNAAHAARDLHAMLQLEIEWITREGTNASHLSDQKLAIYNTVLEEQVGELTRMLGNVWMHPRFSPLAKFAHPFFGLRTVRPVVLKDTVESMLNLYQESLEILSRDPIPEELSWLTNRLGPAKRKQDLDIFGF